MVISIFENTKEIKQIIKDQLLSFSFQNNVDFDAFWFDSTFQTEHLKKYINSSSIAFISLENDCFENVGEIVSRINPLCYICYYSKSEQVIFPLLKTRPYGYITTSLLPSKILETVCEIYERILNSNGYYTYNNKSTFWCFPISSISFFQSDLKYVNIVGLYKEIKIRVTLNEIDDYLVQHHMGSAFIRIHKSYLVNGSFIRCLNKNNHTIEMEDGQILPISDAQYPMVLDFLKAKNTSSRPINVI